MGTETTERKSEFVFIPKLYPSNVFIPPKKCVLCRPIYEVRVFVSSIVFAAAIVG